MKEIKLKFIKRIERTKTVSSFRFSAEEKIDFFPGQFLQLFFDEKNLKNLELNKYLSFSASCTKDYIEVTKRISVSPFSKKLLNLKPDDSVLARLPLGNCIFKEEYKKIGFLIGGIGITPVICILEYINDKKLPTDVLLLYSNKSDDDIAFRKEIDALCAVNKNMKVIYTVTDCQPKDAACVFGLIDKNIIVQYATDLAERIIYVYGPPAMVSEMQKLCSLFSCRKENIKTESFVGY